MKPSLVIVLLFFFFAGCMGTSTTVNRIDIPINRIVKDYEIVGTIRLTVPGGLFTYDKLLSEARKLFKDDKLDVIEIKIDKTSQILSQLTEQEAIINAYVIRYK